MQAVVGNILKEQGKTLSTAESCTGGYVSHLITSVPGSSAYFTGGVVSYANAVKMEELGIPAGMLKLEGAVSKPVVEKMASGVREALKTDWSIAISGVAGPDGGTPEKPVGTVWIAVAGPKVWSAEWVNSQVPVVWSLSVAATRLWQCCEMHCWDRYVLIQTLDHHKDQRPFSSFSVQVEDEAVFPTFAPRKPIRHVQDLSDYR